MFFNKRFITCVSMIFSLHSISGSTLEQFQGITEVKCNVDAGSITINSSDNNGSTSNTDKSVKTDQISGQGYSAEYSAYNTHPDDKIEMSVIGTVLYVLYKKAQQNCQQQTIYWSQNSDLSSYTVTNGSRIDISIGGVNYQSNGQTYPSAHVDFRLQVPNRCNVEINGGATHVDLQKISGDINTKIGSGNITLNDVQGNLDIKTGSGTVYLKNCLTALKNMTQQGPADQYFIKTGSGNISLHNPYVQKIIASTGSGSINMKNIMASKVETSTGSGNIKASYSPDSIHKGTFNFSTGSGSVKIALPSCVKVAQRIQSRHIKSDFINTKENPDLVIKGSTGSGSVHIKASN